MAAFKFPLTGQCWLQNFNNLSLIYDMLKPDYLKDLSLSLSFVFLSIKNWYHCFWTVLGSAARSACGSYCYANILVFSFESPNQVHLYFYTMA